MLQAERQRVILATLVEPALLATVESGKPGKGWVVSWEWYNRGDVVYYISHSALPIEYEWATYYAVPKDQIVAKVLPDTVAAWTQRAED